MRITRWVLLGLASLSTPLAAEEDLAIVQAEAGYRLLRPDPAWRIRQAPPPANVHHSLRIERERGPAEVTVSVYVADVGMSSTADALIAAAAAGWEKKAAGAVEIGTSTVAGSTAPTMTWEMAAAGFRLRVRQHFLVHDGVLFVIQCVAPAEAFAGHEASFGATLSSFTLLPADPARAEARTHRLLAARCGEEVPKARTWAEAAARARREHRLVLVAYELFRGLPIPPLADTTTFMDEDLVALCQERFVVVQGTDGLGAPFQGSSDFGLGAHTFGQGVLFVTPEGRVVGSLGLLEPSLVEERARATLAAHPEAVGRASDEKDAASALRRGDLDRAEALLAAPTRGEEWRLRAALLRRRHLAKEALEALDKAKEAGIDAKEVAKDRGVVLLRSGRLVEAIEAFRAAGDLPAARYWLAVTRATREGVDAVRPELRALAGGDPANRWTWRAAALLLGRGPATGMEALVWPDDAVRSAAAPVAWQTTPRQEWERAAADALKFLLRTQRSNGTWAVPMSFVPDPTAPSTVAVTAIAGTALLRHREAPGVEAAVARATAAVLRARARLLATRGGVFDYTVWAQVFSLRFLAALLRDAPPGEESARLLAAAAEIAEALVKTRAPSGGWSYANLAGAGASADNSISFLTATGLLALAHARDVGVKLPEDALLRGDALVASLRRKDGSFAYQTASPGIPLASEAALRGPLCLLALRRARSGLDSRNAEPSSAQADLAAAIDSALREAGKPLCHTAPDGTSAYYLLFGLRYAAEALSDLPAEGRGEARRVLLDAVLRLRREDGSFCDFPPVGPAYGTAMALEAIEALDLLGR